MELGMRTTTLKLSALALAAALHWSPMPVMAQEAQSPAAAVLDRHLQALAARDVDAVMADYTEQSVFITPQGVLEGKAEIRLLVEKVIDEFSSPEASMTVLRSYSSGPVAYITWSAETPQNSYEFATDTIYVVDDRIRYQTFAADVSPK